MKESKLLEERIRRTKVLFRELGYRLTGGERTKDAYTAAFNTEGGPQGSLFIDRESRFLELGYTYSFSPTMSNYLRDRLDKLMQVCFEFGCYTNIQKGKTEISFSVFSKIYFSGVNYFCLKDTLRDFQSCIEVLTELLDIRSSELDEE